jgi:hypothetical protein
VTHDLDTLVTALYATTGDSPRKRPGLAPWCRAAADLLESAALTTVREPLDEEAAALRSVSHLA